MQLVESHTPASHQPRALSPTEQAVTDSVMRLNMAVQEGERVVIVADRETHALGELFYAGALRHARDVRLLLMPVGQQHGSEPPAAVADAMSAAHVCLLVTSKSLTHTRARGGATAAGARVASMPSLTYEMALRTLTVDYTSIARTSERLADRITAAETIHVSTPGGTDLHLSVKGRRALADTGLFTAAGSFGNLPAGEAFVAPVEGTAHGILVVDAASIVPGVPIGPPTVIRIEDGLAVDVEGAGAGELLSVFARLGDGARNVAELGIGTNPAARLTGNVLESEKVAGTAHVALGNNAHFGGTVDTPFHSDGVLARPTIRADGREILRDGAAVLA